MRRTNAPPRRGAVFLSMLLLASAASAPPLPGQRQAYYSLCRYQGQQDGHPVMYVTDYPDHWACKRHVAEFHPGLFVGFRQGGSQPG